MKPKHRPSIAKQHKTKTAVPAVHPLPEQQLDRMPIWMVLLIYLFYLNTTKQRSSESAWVLHTLIIVVALVLISLLLVAVGAPQEIAKMLTHWPLLP